MKPTLATITLFFFLFTFSTEPSSVRANLLEPVVDASGKEVEAGESYNISSAWIGLDGLSFDTFGNRTCPHIVVQETLESGKPWPVKFLPLNSTNKVIYTSSNLNIEFIGMNSACVESGVWKIIKFTSEELNVATNGFPGRGYWFKIEKAESDHAYKITYCPNPKSIACQELGVFFHGNDGKRYVSLANPPKLHILRVKFVKANVKNAIDDDANADEAVMSI